MSLSYDVTACEGRADWTDEQNARTTEIIFATMVIGLNAITAVNAEAFWYRLDMYQKVSPVPGPQATAADVRRLIGLRTNASPMTEAEFRKHMARISRDRSRSAWLAADPVPEPAGVPDGERNLYA